MLRMLKFLNLQILKSSSWDDYNYLSIEVLIIVLTIWLSSEERSQNDYIFMLTATILDFGRNFRKKIAPKIFSQLKSNTHKLWTFQL